MLIWAFSALFPPASAAANKLLVTKLKPGETAVQPGVYYSLPKTVVRLDVGFKKVTQTPGDHPLEAAIYFNPVLAPAVTVASTAYSIDTAKVSSRETADPDEIYRVELTPAWLKDRRYKMQFAPDGALESGEISITNRRLDFFLSLLGTMVKLGTFATMTVMPDCPALIAEWAYDSGNAKPDSAPGKKFCEIARLMLERQRILGADLITNGTSRLTEDLEKNIAQLAARYFLGSKKEMTWAAKMEAAPTKGVLLSYDLGCFALQTPKAEILGAVPGEFAGGTCSKREELQLELNAHPNSTHGRFAKCGDGEHSFAFRVPALMSAELKGAGKVHDRTIVAVAQNGTIGCLPADVGGKKSSILVTLHPSGALKTVEVGVEAQGGIAEALGSSAVTLAEAAAKDTTLIDAQNRQKLLDAQVAIRRAECILSGECPLNSK